MVSTRRGAAPLSGRARAGLARPVLAALLAVAAGCGGARAGRPGTAGRDARCEDCSCAVEVTFVNQAGMVEKSEHLPDSPRCPEHASCRRACERGPGGVFRAREQSGEYARVTTWTCVCPS